jgi:Zn-dependent metalloprotease
VLRVFNELDSGVFNTLLFGLYPEFGDATDEDDDEYKTIQESEKELSVEDQTEGPEGNTEEIKDADTQSKITLSDTAEGVEVDTAEGEIVYEALGQAKDIADTRLKDSSVNIDSNTISSKHADESVESERATKAQEEGLVIEKIECYQKHGITGGYKVKYQGRRERVWVPETEVTKELRDKFHERYRLDGKRRKRARTD